MSHFAERLQELLYSPRLNDAARVRVKRQISMDLHGAHYVRWAEMAASGARKRAKLRGIDCSINVEWILERLRSQAYRCALSGIEFSQETLGTAHKRPFMPSLDRIECSIGYTPGNSRIVCVAVNMLLQDWGDAVFIAIVNGSRNRAG